MKNIVAFSIIILLMSACTKPAATPVRQRAKFEPADGKVIVFAGQELESVGGLEAPYNDGYLDHFERPAGWTSYSNLGPGDSAFGFVQKGLDGLFTTDDWGDSPSNLTLQLNDSSFNNMAVAIGLSLVNHTGPVVRGERDSLLQVMGDFFKAMKGRPVFLRVGYEFDGYAWNHYDREEYIKAFRHVRDRLDKQGVTNVAYVWQSTGWVSNLDQLEAWYPGDDYVDWCAYSFFSRWDEDHMIAFARRKGKPVFIAEASATISDFTVKFDGQTKETILGNPVQAIEAWEKWFVPFFNTIHDNPDVVKAFSYINCRWRAHEMWKTNPTFQKVDARLQRSPQLMENWKKEMAKPCYVNADDVKWTE